jgi:hypothetical protein
VKHSIVRGALALAVAATGVVGVAPSHAGPADDVWVVIGSGQVGGGPDLTDIVDLVVGTIADARDKVCKPQYTDVQPGGLSWTLYQNQSTNAIAFEWFGSGTASVSDDCATNVAVTVQVTDYAPAGNPPAAAGNPGRGGDGAASGGVYTAYGESRDFVVYYDPAALYQRGNSVVELKVTGSYYNKKAKATLPLGCKETHTSITPWPTGPTGTTGPVEECGS